MRKRTLLAKESTPWTATNSLCAGEYSTIKRENRSGQQNSSRFSITFKFSSSSSAKRRRPIDNFGRKRRTNRPLSRGVSSKHQQNAEPGVAPRPGPHSFSARHHAVAAAPAG